MSCALASERDQKFPDSVPQEALSAAAMTMQLASRWPAFQLDSLFQAW